MPFGAIVMLASFLAVAIGLSSGDPIRIREGANLTVVPSFRLDLPRGVMAPPPAMRDSVVLAAREQTLSECRYDPSYLRIAYPGGDVPANTGVCSDVVVRAFRAAGIDLQKLVHEDMKRAFHRYPPLWGLSSPDSNIDHRRVPNLMTFFRNSGAEIASDSSRRGDLERFEPGDVVAWSLGGGVMHIGIVIDESAPGSDRPLVVHNIGAGPVIEDFLGAYSVIGHYRYPPRVPSLPEKPRS